MSHQQYEQWLFAYYDDAALLSPDERLTSQQEADLQAHLKGCADCRQLAQAWQSVGERLRQAPPLEPSPGFVQRWERRLQADREQVLRRQTAVVLGFSAAGAALLLASLALLLLPWIQSPKALVWAGVYRLITVLSYLQLAQDVVLPFFQAASSTISPISPNPTNHTTANCRSRRASGFQSISIIPIAIRQSNWNWARYSSTSCSFACGWFSFSSTKSSSTSTSMFVFMKQRYACSGEHTIGSPRTLKLVLMITGQPVNSSKRFTSR